MTRAQGRQACSSQVTKSPGCLSSGCPRPRLLPALWDISSYSLLKEQPEDLGLELCHLFLWSSQQPSEVRMAKPHLVLSDLP